MPAGVRAGHVVQAGGGNKHTPRERRRIRGSRRSGKKKKNNKPELTEMEDWTGKRPSCLFSICASDRVFARQSLCRPPGEPPGCAGSKNRGRPPVAARHWKSTTTTASSGSLNQRGRWRSQHSREAGRLQRQMLLPSSPVGSFLP